YRTRPRAYAGDDECDLAGSSRAARMPGADQRGFILPCGRPQTTCLRTVGAGQAGEIMLLQGGAVPTGSVRGRLVGAGEEGEQILIRRRRVAHGGVGEDELAEFLAVRGGGRLHGRLR